MSLSLLGRPLRTVHMRDNELSVETITVSGAGITSIFAGIRIGRKPNENPLLSPPGLLDSVTRKITPELLVNYIGCEEKRDLPQLR